MNVFFATGYQKSGTTYLQQLLDHHPQISCPPEHHLKTLIIAFKSVLEQYRNVIAQIDDRTGRQGLRYNENVVLQHTLRGAIGGLLAAGARPGATQAGLSDNSLWRHFPLFEAIFPAARYVGIVRDPRAVAVSLYSHRLRTEADFAASGLTQPKLAAIVAREWAACVTSLEAFAGAAGDRISVVRYEDLAGPDASTHLTRLYAFLGVDPGSDTVAAALAENAFETRKAESGGFLQAGPGRSWEAALTADDVAAMERVAGPLMRKHGYD